MSKGSFQARFKFTMEGRNYTSIFTLTFRTQFFNSVRTHLKPTHNLPSLSGHFHPISGWQAISIYHKIEVFITPSA